jgi:hypothetical protein
MNDLPDVIDRLEHLEPDKPEHERLMKNLALRVLDSAEEAFVSSGVLEHRDVLYNRDVSEQGNLHGQEHPPEQNRPPGYQPGRYSPDRNAPDRHTPVRGALERSRLDRHGRVRTGEQDSPEREDPPQQEDRVVRGNRSAEELFPGWERDYRDRFGNVPDGCYIDMYGRVRSRRWWGEDDSPGSDGAPAELSMREKLFVARSELQKARREFEGARTLTQAEILGLPRPVTENDIGVTAVQKLGRRTRALTNAILAYKDTYQKARKAGVTEGGEQTADFTEREDDGYVASVWEQIIESGKARVRSDWDGLEVISQEASPTRDQLDKSLRMLLSPRLGEDASHVAGANSRYRDGIDALGTEGFQIREQGLFPDPVADELTFE